MGANQIRPPIQMPQFIQPKRNADNMFDWMKHLILEFFIFFTS